MATFSAPIDVFRMAMPLVGASPPSSIDDQTAEAIAAKAVYEGLVGEALCRSSWSWAVKRATLTYQGETGDAPHYAYALPADVLKVRKVLYGRIDFRDYELRAGKLLCDLPSNTELQALYNWRAPESSWPADFGMAMVYKLAAALCRGLLDMPNRGNDLDGQAEEKLRVASVLDRRASGRQNAMAGSGLVEAWGRRTTRGYTRASS